MQRYWAYWKMIHVSKDEIACANCVYYHQHYVSANDGAFCIPCGCGHCTYLRTKTRKPSQHCDKFERRENNGDVKTKPE